MRKQIIQVAMVVLSFLFLCAPLSSAQNNDSPTIAAEAMLTSDMQDLGHSDPGAMIHILVSLRFNRENELQKLTAEQSDPASPNYHHYLRNQEFDERFGPTLDQVNDVVTKLTSSGFQVTGVADNRLQVYASATTTMSLGSVHREECNWGTISDSRSFYICVNPYGSRRIAP